MQIEINDYRKEIAENMYSDDETTTIETDKDVLISECYTGVSIKIDKDRILNIYQREFGFEIKLNDKMIWITDNFDEK